VVSSWFIDVEFLSCELPQSGNHLRDTLAINSGSYERLCSDTPRASMASASVTVMSRELSGSPPYRLALTCVFVGQGQHPRLWSVYLRSHSSTHDWVAPDPAARTNRRSATGFPAVSVWPELPRTNYPAASATFSKARDVGQKFLRSYAFYVGRVEPPSRSAPLH
jgi:hypothetical protein